MINVLENKSKTSQQAIIDALCFTMMLNNYIFYVNSIGRWVFAETPFDTLIIYILYIFIIMKALLYILEDINLKSFFLCTLLFLFVLISSNINNKLVWDEYGTTIINTYFAIFLGTILGAHVTDYELFEKKLYNYSIVSGILMVISFVIYHFILEVTWGSAAMGLSYMALIPCVSVFYCVLLKFDLKKFILLILLIAIISIEGSRGPLLGVMVLPFLALLSNVNKKNTIRFIISFVLLFSLFLYFFEDIMDYLLGITLRFRFDAKILNSIATSQLLDPHGRDIIWSQMKNIILNNPLGIGYLGERPLIGTYSHNIIIEMLADFRLIIGPIILIILASMLIYKLVIANYNKKNVIIIILCAFILKLFLSGSFWTEPMFFAFIMLISN